MSNADINTSSSTEYLTSESQKNTSGEQQASITVYTYTNFQILADVLLKPENREDFLAYYKENVFSRKNYQQMEERLKVFAQMHQSLTRLKNW